MKCFYINLNRTFRISLSSKEHLVPPRAHFNRRINTYILYFVTAGELPLKLNGEDIVLSKGDICLFDKGDVQQPTVPTDCEYFYVHFECAIRAKELSPEDIFDAINSKNKAFSSAELLDYTRYDHMIAILPQRIKLQSDETLEYLTNEFKKVKLHVWNMSIEQRIELCQSIALLFVKIERLYVDSYLSAKSDGHFQGIAKIKQIADFVDRNYNKSFSSTDIEREFSLSYDHVNRLFKQRMGMGIIAYRNRLRIEKAKILLLTTEMSMEAISDEIGFYDKYYFSKFFKKTVGVSPTHFKRGVNIAF